MIEIWKDIKGYEGKYQISNLGNVKSLGNGNARNPNYNKERILKPGLSSSGHLMVHLSKDGQSKSFTVHRLVANAFISNPNNYPVINHKDENKKNNNVNNLEWCTHQYNVNYGEGIQKRIVSHFIPIKMYDLITKETKNYLSISDASRDLNIKFSSIWCSINRNKSPYKKRYIFSEIKN